MKLNLSPAPHVHTNQSTRTLMRNVLIALLPCAVAGVGFFGFNALMVLLCSWIVRPHFEIAGFWWALGFSLVLTLVNWALHLFVPEKKKKR